MPKLPQSIQAASKIKALSNNCSFHCQSSRSRSRQLPRSNPYLKKSVVNARAHPVDPGSFQDQILTVVNAGAPQSTQAASKIKSLLTNSPFQCQSSPSRSRQLPRSKSSKIAFFSARAPVDTGSFQDQILMKIIAFNTGAPAVRPGSFQDQIMIGK